MNPIVRMRCPGVSVEDWIADEDNVQRVTWAKTDKATDERCVIELAHRFAVDPFVLAYQVEQWEEDVVRLLVWHDHDRLFEGSRFKLQIPTDNSIQARFAQFHNDHPEVYEALLVYAMALVRKGYERLSISMLWEHMRYETMVGAKVPEEDAYRLNNTLRSRYARLLMEREPVLAGRFETRRLRA